MVDRFLKICFFWIRGSPFTLEQNHQQQEIIIFLGSNEILFVSQRDTSEILRWINKARSNAAHHGQRTRDVFVPVNCANLSTHH